MTQMTTFVEWEYDSSWDINNQPTIHLKQKQNGTTNNKQPTTRNLFEATKQAMLEIPFHKTEPNTPLAEQIAIKTLSNNKEITIKPFGRKENSSIEHNRLHNRKQ